MKKLLLVILAIILATTTNTCALADTISLPPADQISSNPNQSVYTWQKMNVSAETDNEPEIVFTQESISKVSSTSVAIFAMSQANATASTMVLNMVVQRWRNNTWEPYQTVSELQQLVSFLTRSATVTVESGYYYRLAVTHIAVFPGKFNTVKGHTESLFVN